MLFDDGELIAILVELADESHGDIRGRWAIESTFGLNPGQRPETFASAEDAATWITQHISRRPFALSQYLVELQ